MINLNTYTLSRCIYLIGKGEFNQEQEIDHIDCNSLNNHLDNLRLADCSDNCKNKKLSKVNTSGFKGVHWCKMRKAWISQINVNGKKIYLGKYSTPEGAHDSYIRASVEFHGDFGRVA